MKKNILLSIMFSVICNLALASTGHIVVANRGSSSISIIDAATNAIVNVSLPAAAAVVEPMYVNYSALANRIFIGDRANNRVIVLDSKTYAFEGTIAAGNGIFHQWVNEKGGQLWINNDIDKTTTVVNARTLKPLAIIPTPADLVAQGGKPHDVFVDPGLKRAYVSVIGLQNESDYIVQFSTETFQEIARAKVGLDSHLFARYGNAYLYVASQNSNQVFVLRRSDLQQIKVLNIPGAHGIFMNKTATTLYVTNISGAGTSAIYTLDAKTNQLIGSPVNTTYSTPHNVALSGDDTKLYVSHSGATSNKVSIFDIPCQNCTPVFNTVVDVGLNPFGMGLVP